MLATYCLPLFLHPIYHLDLGAPNLGIHHIACSPRQGGRHLGGLPLALEGWRWRPQWVRMAEAELRQRRHLPGESAAEMAGCWPEVWFYWLGGFPVDQSWHYQALKFQAHQCRITAPLVVHVRQAHLLRPREFSSSSLICPTRSGLLAGIVSEFLADLT